MANLEKQTSAYRRGLVLGLTMAEIAILIIFVLLLAFAALLVRQQDKQKEAERVAEERQETITLLETQLEAQFSAMQEILPGGDKNIEELQRELVLLRDAKQQLARLQSTAEAAGFLSEPETIVNTLELGREYSTVRELLPDGERNVEKLLELVREYSAGKGTEVPSCWTLDDGTIEYIYDVNLTPTGLIVRATNLPHRADERQMLPIQNIVLDQDIPEQSFLSTTSELFEWSKSKKCRFFVRVFDSTGPTDKKLYQERLRAVESRFYKLMVGEVF